MRKNYPVRVLPAFLLVGLTLFTACDAPEPTEASAEPQFTSVSGVSLVQCPAAEPLAAVGGVLPLGGLVALGGNSVSAPLGAVLGSTVIEIEAPASPYMLIELTANGQEHWQFLAPLRVTIDYSRCPAEALARGPLSVWLVDPATGEMLQNMGGQDNRQARRITFVTDHFSGYAIAN